MYPDLGLANPLHDCFTTEHLAIRQEEDIPSFAAQERHSSFNACGYFRSTSRVYVTKELVCRLSLFQRRTLQGRFKAFGSIVKDNDTELVLFP
jgi:hypothetical protein